ncbi:MAG: hypothetical protein WCC24_04110 [Terracidiphilus sp.]
MRSRILWGILCLSVFGHLGFGQNQEVTIGAQLWKYDRVYPLLDGLFQDAASTQVQLLTLDPNKANSSQLDALIQSFQVQAGFNQLAGAQNAAAAQMAVANTAYQSALAGQQQSLMMQSIAAQQALTKATQDVTAANAGTDQAQIAAANLEQQNAQALVTGLTAEQNFVKSSGTPFAPSSFSGTVAATPSTFTSGVPSGVLSAGSASGTPSFPATKQLDNQMDLLRSRLARVVGVMSRPDSIAPTTKMFMVEIDTATFPHKDKKGRVLETRYQLNCGEVVDLMPRVASVNVANTKYRDNADIFGVLLSFFSFGINASYNREHLKMSQTLGQSSYITGYGVGQSSFGWKFGIPLGDNFVSSDTKTTFAIIAAPVGCTPQLASPTILWEQPDGSEPNPGAGLAVLGNVNAELVAEAPAAVGAGDPPAGDPPSSDVSSISFNRVSYNPATYTPANPALVAISVTLTRPIDQQATLSANGILLKRARDTFGRAIPNGNGSGGLLEESTSIAQANTWIPISPENLLITLDAGQFGSDFPTIEINNPAGQRQRITNSIEDNFATVSGHPLRCLTTSAFCQLPSLGYTIPANVNLGVMLWEANCQPPGSTTCTGLIVLQAPLASASSTSSAGTTTQVVSGATANPWGPNPEVYLQVPDQSPTEFKLKCRSQEIDPTWTGSDVIQAQGNLICQFWDSETLPDFATVAQNTSGDFQLEVIDQGHTGGALLGTAVLPSYSWGQNAPGLPRLWAATSPQWYDSNGGHWEFKLTFANVDQTNSMTLSPDPINNGKPLPATSCDAPSHMCTWTFDIAAADFEKWFDRIGLTLQNDPNDQWQLLNIESQISPRVTTISADNSSWFGTNFTSVFSSSTGSANKTGLLVGSNLIPINCPVVTSCVVTDTSKLKNATGAMVLQTAFGQFALMQVTANGLPQQITIQPQNKTQGAGTQTGGGTNAGGATVTATAQAPVTIVIGGSAK